MADYIAIVRGVQPNGRSWSTSRHITSGQTEAALLTTWQNAWTTAWNLATTGLNTVYTTGLTITQFEVGTLNGSMRKISKSVANVSLAGIATGTSLPANNSIVVDWTSATTQRYGRGRQALPAPADSQVVNDDLVAGTATNVKAAMTSVHTAVAADGSTYFVFPRFTTQGGQPAFQKTVVTTALVRNKTGSQRKRYKKETVSYT
jgi:predicted trehalose synthase